MKIAPLFMLTLFGIGVSVFCASCYAQEPIDAATQDSQQTNPVQCPDGSTVSGDGISTCPTNQTGSRQQTTPPQDRQRQNSFAGDDSDFAPRTKSGALQRSQELPPEAPSEFQRFVLETTGKLLPIYGAKLFRDVPSTFSPDNVAPVTSDYVIGPDDELRVRIWGQVQYSGNLRVDRSGNIYLPDAGSVHVAGLPFAALDQHLRAAVGRVYRNFDLTADMGRIRSIQIYVAGQARRPGAYTVSSLSSLVDALFASGGPSAQGSLRHIELKRDGKIVTDFDLYAFLIKGDKSGDLRLLPEDVLYIPAAGPQVAIDGSIRVPGIYELRSGETLQDAIKIAGDTTALSSNARVSLERIDPAQGHLAMELNFDAKGLAAPLMDADLVRIFPIIPSYKSTVTLRGNVANPGRFGWRDQMHLRDLIPDQASLLSRDYWWKRSHLGLPAPEFEPFIDRLGSQSRNQPTRQRSSGNSTQTYSSTQPNINGEQVRQSSSTQYQEPIPDSRDLSPDAVGTEADRDEMANGRDDSNTLNRQGASGSLASDVADRKPPENELDRKKTKVTIPTSEIDWKYAVVERLDPKTLKTSLIPFDLGKLILDHDESQNLALEPGDTVTIFSQSDLKVPLEEQTKYVTLEGEVARSGIYSVGPGETLRDLIQRAGGLTSNAYLFGSEFQRESTRKIQQSRLDEYTRKAELDAARGALALTTSATSSQGSTVNATAANAAEQQLIQRLREVKATGRIVLNFPAKGSTIADVPAVALENGDHFIVPPVPATVNVVGAVYDQNSFLYQNHTGAGRYLQMAGGANRDADRGRTFVIRADGSVINRAAMKGYWGNRFDEMKLNPGDTIVVPDKTLRPTALRGVLDWTQIFSQLALGAAAVQVLK